jgi:hypothetical protein
MRVLNLKMFKKNTCQICLDYANACGELSEDTPLCNFRAYNTATTFGNLRMPHEHFAFYVAQLENKFSRPAACLKVIIIDVTK